MFPIILDVKILKIVLAGNGKATLRRLELLDEAGAQHVKVFADRPIPELATQAGARLRNMLPKEQDFTGIHLAMLADFDEKQTAELAAFARNKGVLVNAEDKAPWCDYHVPAIIRRGDLLLTVSTGGGSPRLARRLRIWLSTLFGEEWGDRLKTISTARKKWKAEGNDFKQLAEKTDALLAEKGWLDELEQERKTS
ncbi:MAG: siroheme synthase [Proteobacteria bacterium]|nr:siroheme synthase [Pseudomonadota bacterium]